MNKFNHKIVIYEANIFPKICFRDEFTMGTKTKTENRKTVFNTPATVVRRRAPPIEAENISLGRKYEKMHLEKNY